MQPATGEEKTSLRESRRARRGGSATSWLESLSPWPEEFGLERMRELLGALGDPQRSYPTIHVVGTNGKGSTTLLAAALLRAEGLRVGVTISPHVLGWPERIQVDGEHADLERALDRVRPHAAGATQFEVVTAAAFAEFASCGVEVAVVEAGLGGRYDATNVVDAPVVVLTNVALDHTDVLGETREEIAREKLAVVRPGVAVVLGEGEWEPLARDAGAGTVTVVSRSNLALAHAAAEAFLARRVDLRPAQDLRLPGRLQRVSNEPLEIWDGAHNLSGVGYLLPRLPARSYTVVASVLEDKDATGMLAALSVLGEALVATRSSNPRALPAERLAELARPYFRCVEAVEEPTDALARGRLLTGPHGAVLVTGSVYLLADLFARDPTAAPAT